MKKTPPAWHNDLRRLCDGTRTYKELAEMLGQKEGTVNATAIRLALPPPPAARTGRPAMSEEARLQRLEEEAERKAAAKEVEQAERQAFYAEVLKMRETMSLTEVGRELGLTKQRISQIEKEARKSLPTPDAARDGAHPPK